MIECQGHCQSIYIYRGLFGDSKSNWINKRTCCKLTTHTLSGCQHVCDYFISWQLKCSCFVCALQATVCVCSPGHSLCVLSRPQFVCALQATVCVCSPGHSLCVLSRPQFVCALQATVCVCSPGHSLCVLSRPQFVCALQATVLLGLRIFTVMSNISFFRHICFL